jgi:hypothetical protein
LEAVVDKGRNLIQIKVKRGLFEEERIDVITETSIISGTMETNGLFGTTMKNKKDDNDNADSCLLTVIGDNEQC